MGGGGRGKGGGGSGCKSLIASDEFPLFAPARPLLPLLLALTLLQPLLGLTLQVNDRNLSLSPRCAKPKEASQQTYATGSEVTA
jgi:hypothetical protein